MTTTETPSQRARVFHDPNRGGWCWQLPGRLPVQAESFTAAWTALVDRGRPPTISDPVRAGDDRVPVVRWWHRWFLP